MASSESSSPSPSDRPTGSVALDADWDEVDAALTWVSPDMDPPDLEPPDPVSMDELRYGCSLKLRAAAFMM